jgi:type VI secretion system protein ImpJ
MRNLRRVVWSRGMFLTPQHFQTLDSWIDENAQFRFTASNFANWGVLDLHIDQESLSNGLFTLQGCQGILPDGTVFSIPTPDAAPVGRQIADHFTPDHDHLDVFLALPERQPAGKNFTQSAELQAGIATTRYIADTLETVDENGYGESKSVQVAIKNFKLLLDNQTLDGFVALQIARVIRGEAGNYTLDPAFVAPCLDVASSDYLMNLLRRQIEILVSKGDSLNASRRQRGESLADFNASEAGSFWFLHTVNSTVPELQHIWTVRRGHPEALWVVLLRLAGALATFSLETKARDLPSYDHRKLGPCFTALDDKIRGLLETVIRSKCVSIPLRLLERSIWTGTVSNDEYFKTGSFYFAVNAKIDVSELIKKVPDLVKFSPSEEIHQLVNYALPGIKLRHEQTPPGAITFKLNNHYFSLNQTGRLWERIVQTRNFSLFIPPEIAEAQPEVLVVLQ